MYIIEKDWIDDNVTGLTIPQAKILDMEWEDVIKGWKRKTVGKKISNARKELFERLRGVKGKVKQKRVIDNFKRGLK